ncbi:MAG: ABC transporter substrate-binding protein, partial [Acidimicrobiales bacterium]
MTYLIAVLAFFGLIAAACGDDDAEPSATEDTAVADTADTTEPADDTADDTADDDAADTGADGPLLIGAAIDLTSNMAPFDAPALAAAQISIDEINAAGGVNGREIQLEFIDTALDPDQTKQAAVDLLAQGAEILVTTCDVDFATPAVQEGIDAGVLTVAPCIGTDQMGPCAWPASGAAWWRSARSC